jgi:hypothetical protein
MKIILGLAALVFLMGTAGAQTKRVALTPQSTISHGLIAKNMDRCQITLTLDATKADYLLEATGELAHSGNNYRRVDFTVFSLSGDVLFHTRTIQIKNAVKDVCKFIEAQK